jgi:hypothetical protein
VWTPDARCRDAGEGVSIRSGCLTGNRGSGGLFNPERIVTDNRCTWGRDSDAPRTWQANFSVPFLNQQHHDSKIQEAEDFLHQDFSARFTVEDLAQRFAMSARNLARRCRLATGDTPPTCLHALRITVPCNYWKRITGRCNGCVSTQFTRMCRFQNNPQTPCRPVANRMPGVVFTNTFTSTGPVVLTVFRSTKGCLLTGNAGYEAMRPSVRKKQCLNGGLVESELPDGDIRLVKRLR